MVITAAVTAAGWLAACDCNLLAVLVKQQAPNKQASCLQQ